MSRPALRPFGPGDAAALRVLWVASWNATLPEIDFATRLDWFDGWLSDHLADGGAVICAVDERDAILGFVGIAARTGHMEQIAVDPASFGRGVGQVLLDAAKSLCPDGITLRVNRENARAVAFYRRAGFVVTGEGINPGGQRPVLDMAWRA